MSAHDGFKSHRQGHFKELLGPGTLCEHNEYHLFMLNTFLRTQKACGNIKSKFGIIWTLL